MSCRVGVDIDDVLMPWAETAVGLTQHLSGGQPAAEHWHYWREWPCTDRQVWDVLDEATVSGGLYDLPPYDGVLDELTRLSEGGCSIHLITARGFVGQYAGLIRRLTTEWVETWGVPHDTLTFAKDKAAIAYGSGWWFVDDSVRNYDALAAAGVNARLLNRPHNRPEGGVDLRARVSTVSEFADEVLADIRARRRTYTDEVRARFGARGPVAS